MKISKKLLSEIAQEAHTMGRIYSTGGEKLSPAKEFERVEKMVVAKLSFSKVIEDRHAFECKDGGTCPYLDLIGCDEKCPSFVPVA